MNDEQRKMIAATARMEGEAAVISNIGKKVQLSEMELICLANFAVIGLFTLFSECDGAVGDEAAADLERTIDAIRRDFGRDGMNNGLERLSKSAAALLRSPKVFPYVCR